MKNNFTLLMLFLLAGAIELFAQNNTFVINNSSNQIVNWNSRYTFSGFYGYDSDLDEIITGPFETKCTVVIDLVNGKGSLTHSYNRGYSNGVMQVSKAKHDISYCVKRSNCFEFTAETLVGNKYKMYLFFNSNGNITKFQSIGSNNVGIVFY